MKCYWCDEEIKDNDDYATIIVFVKIYVAHCRCMPEVIVVLKEFGIDLEKNVIH